MIKAGIIGLGAISSVHRDAIRAAPGAELTAVCDIRADRLWDGFRQYTDYTDMLRCEDLDVVHICTPHDLHSQMACACLHAGTHVFLEKPVGMYRAEGEKINAAMKESRKLVCVALQNRCNETSKMIKKIIDSGIYGKLIGMRAVLTWQRTGSYYTDSTWRGKIDREGGALLMNQAVHTLDLMNYFAASPIKSVSGNTANRGNLHIIDEEDTAEAYITYENGVRGIFFGTNAYTRNECHSMELHLENACLSLYKNTLYLEKDGQTEKIATDEVMDGEKSYWGLGHKFLIHDFYNCLENGKGSYVPLCAGIDVLELCDMIYRASNQRRVINK